MQKKQQKYLNNVLLPKVTDTIIKFLNGTDLEKNLLKSSKE